MDRFVQMKHDEPIFQLFTTIERLVFIVQEQGNLDSGTILAGDRPIQ